MKSFLAGVVGLSFVVANSHALTIQVDYSHDGGYFADPANAVAKATLEKAAADLSTALTDAGVDALGAVPTNSFTGTTNAATANFEWDVALKDPVNITQTITLSTFSAAADTFTIFAGAATGALDGAEALGEGGTSAGEYSLTFGGSGNEAEYESAIYKAENLFNATLSRGGGPRLYTISDSTSAGSTTVNYTLEVGSLAGFLTFDKSKKWHFDYQTAVADDEYDFYSVMLHELMHSLGFGSSASWNQHVSGADWTGAHVISLMGTGTGLIHQYYDNDPAKPDGHHVAETVMSNVLGTDTKQTAVMASDLANGVRKKLTELDVAFMLDLDTPRPDPVDTVVKGDATPTPTPTIETVVPLTTPVVAGKPPKSTQSSKVKLSGTLKTPGAYVVYKIGSGKYVKASGGAAWKITLKLKPGKNIIYIASYNPATGETSTPKKIIITRK
jgi:hypothetical protein